MDIQKLFDAISAASRDTRKEYHLTLGSLIEALEAAPADAVVCFSDQPEASPCEPHSYRGYYADLAFEHGPIRKVAEVLAEARGALGESFEGYKGGDFTMGEDTPLWRSSYGHNSGVALIAASLDAAGRRLVIATKQID